MLARPCGSTGNVDREEIPRPHVAATALELLFNEIFQRMIFHRHLGIHAFELAVLGFELPIAPQLGYAQSTEL